MEHHSIVKHHVSIRLGITLQRPKISNTFCWFWANILNPSNAISRCSSEILIIVTRVICVDMAADGTFDIQLKQR